MDKRRIVLEDGNEQIEGEVRQKRGQKSEIFFFTNTAIGGKCRLRG